MEGNTYNFQKSRFEFTGKVKSIDIQFKDNGTVITSLRICQKKKNGTFDNFFISAFNSEKRKLAEELSENIKADDYVNVTGYITTYSYRPQGADKDKFNTQFIATDFTKVCYNSEDKKFEPIAEQKQERYGEQEVISDEELSEEIPF